MVVVDDNDDETNNTNSKNGSRRTNTSTTATTSSAPKKKKIKRSVGGGCVVLVFLLLAVATGVGVILRASDGVAFVAFQQDAEEKSIRLFVGTSGVSKKKEQQHQLADEGGLASETASSSKSFDIVDTSKFYFPAVADGENPRSNNGGAAAAVGTANSSFGACLKINDDNHVRMYNYDEDFGAGALSVEPKDELDLLDSSNTRPLTNLLACSIHLTTDDKNTHSGLWSG